MFGRSLLCVHSQFVARRQPTYSATENSDLCRQSMFTCSRGVQRHLNTREHFKLNRAAALSEWRQIGAA